MRQGAASFPSFSCLMSPSLLPSFLLSLGSEYVLRVAVRCCWGVMEAAALKHLMLLHPYFLREASRHLRLQCYAAWVPPDSLPSYSLTLPLPPACQPRTG